MPNRFNLIALLSTNIFKITKDDEKMVKLFGNSGVRGLINFDATLVLVCKVGLAGVLPSKAVKANVAVFGR